LIPLQKQARRSYKVLSHPPAVMVANPRAIRVCKKWSFPLSISISDSESRGLQKPVLALSFDRPPPHDTAESRSEMGLHLTGGKPFAQLHLKILPR
jgi:hypothetical protein